MENEILLRMNEDGVFEEYKPFATIECPTEEDYRHLEEAVRYKEAHRWIPVSERLPETDNKNTHAYDVLVYIPKREGCSQYGVYIGKLKTVAADDGTGNFWGLSREECAWTVWGYSYFNTPVVTHWMPIPEPPKEG